MAKFLLAIGLSGALFGGLVGAFCGSADSITDAMVTYPRGSAVASLVGTRSTLENVAISGGWRTN